MYSDPQSVTITGFNSSNAISLPRTETSGTRSLYTSADGLTSLEISHQPQGKAGQTGFARIRSMIRLDQRILATDPLNAERSVYQKCGAYVVVDRPEFGFTQTQMVNIAASLLTLATASSNAALVKLTGSEH